MKRLLFIASLMLLCTLNNSICAQFTTNGNSYSSVKKSTAKSEPIATPYTFNVKGVEYPIFISSNGCAFIVRTSKSGNEYKQYLGEEISKDICSKMNIEYKGK